MDFHSLQVVGGTSDPACSVQPGHSVFGNAECLGALESAVWLWSVPTLLGLDSDFYRFWSVGVQATYQ
jgi:hypothetical protein